MDENVSCEGFHMIHLVISNRIKEWTITYSYSYYIHLNLYGNIVVRLTAIYYCNTMDNSIPNHRTHPPDFSETNKVGLRLRYNCSKLTITSGDV